MKRLSNTSVAEPFEIYATYEVPFDSKKPDIALHNLIRKSNPGLRVTENREFFEIEPWDAYELLESMAIIHNRLDKLVRYNANDYGSEENDGIEEIYSVDKLFGESGDERYLYEYIKDITEEIIGHEVKAVPLKRYVAFKKDKKHNLICVWPKSGWVEVVLSTKLGSIKDDTETIYDISNRCWTGAQYAFRFDDSVDVEIVKDLIRQTYNLK